MTDYPESLGPGAGTFYQQLLALLEFTRDMDRNRDDASFARHRQGVHYVFDENVFEFFIGARTQRSDISESDKKIIFEDKRKYSAVFHLFEWRDKPEDQSERADWTRMNRQTALVTAEYLLGGHLPGQKTRRLYITEWHAAELAHRFNLLFKHFTEKAKSARAKGTNIDRDQRDISRIVDLVAKSRPEVSELLAKSALRTTDINLIRADLRKLEKVDGIDRPTLIDFVAARIFAAKLIGDDILEPLQQLRRVFSKEIAARLFPVALFHVRPNRSGIHCITEDASAWESRIKDEEKIRGLSDDLRRNPIRLKADAQSIAHVQWIADQLEAERKERMVLVTGDTLLFDAYRRWWTDVPGRPFIMRRVTQFAPILNFRDAKSTIAFDNGIFENTRRAIEPLLMYFNLAEEQFEDSASDPIARQEKNAPGRQQALLRRHGGREHFALLLKQPDTLESQPMQVFTQRLDHKIFDEDQPHSHQELRRSWQQLERVAVGVNRSLVQLRLENEQRRQLIESLKAPDAHGIDRFVNQQLHGLFHHGALLCVPETIQAIREWPVRTNVAFTKRAPIALRLRGPDEGGTSPLAGVDVALLANDLTSGKGATAVEFDEAPWIESPERLFALAAAMALRLALWDQAAKYAQLAVGSSAAEAMKQRPRRAERADYFELLYLRALTSRFKMGDVPSIAADGETQSRQLLDAALQDLTVCLDYHDADEPPGRHLLRALRALSERAAVRLFYVTWMFRQYQLKNSTGFDRDRTIHEMHEAYFDLRGAAERFASAFKRGTELDEKVGGTEYGRFFDLVKQQTTNNIAAWYVFSRLIEVIEEGKVEEFSPKDDMSLFQRVRDDLRRKIDRDDFDEPNVLRADIYAFLWLFDEDRNMADKLAALLRQPDAALAMDSEIMKLYKRLVPLTSDSVAP